MAHQGARIRAPVVIDGSSAVRSHHVAIKIHQPLSTNRWGGGSHAVGRVAHRTAEPVLIGMQIVLRGAGVRKNLREIVAFAHIENGPATLVSGLGKRFVTGPPGIAPG